MCGDVEMHVIYVLPWMWAHVRVCVYVCRWLNDNANDLILYAMAEARMTKLTAELSTGNVRLNSTHQIPYKHAETQFKEWIRALAVCQMAHRDNPHPSRCVLRPVPCVLWCVCCVYYCGVHSYICLCLSLCALSSNALAVVDVETGERVVAVPWTPTLPSHKVGTPANTTTEKQKDGMPHAPMNVCVSG
jgi:hypothetical protein